MTMFHISKQTLVILSILALVIFSGCNAKKQNSLHFYTIEYPAEKQLSFSTDTLPLSYRLDIEVVKVDPVFASQLIVLRKKSNTIQYFSNHQWAARAPQSLTAFLRYFFNENAIFTTKHITTKVTPQIKLLTHIHRLEVLQGERKALEAHLDVEFSLQHAKTGKIILSHREQMKEPLAARDINLFAQTISEQFFFAIDAFTHKAIELLSEIENHTRL